MRAWPIWVLAVLALAGTAFGAAQKSSQTELPLDPDNYFWQFGMIPRDAQVGHHYALTNNHDTTVTITEIIADCDCTHVPKAPIAVAPGETYLLKVLFDTKTYFGETNRDIHLVTDYGPSPEMTVYFTSLASRLPSSISIMPNTTAFITGKDSQTFTIENLVDEKSGFKIFLDNDSLFTLSETEFTIKGKNKKELTVMPIWDRIPKGSLYTCIVVEVIREESFRVSIPIKVNRF